MECNKREQIAAHPGSPGSPGHGQSGGTLLWFCWRFYIQFYIPHPPGYVNFIDALHLKYRVGKISPPAVARGWRRGLLVIPRPRRPHLQLSRRCHSGLLIYGVPHSGEPDNIVTFQHRRSCAILRCVPTTMNIYLRFPIIASPPLVMCHQINAQLPRPRLWSARVTRAGPRLLRVACCIFVRWAFITAQPEEPRLEERGLDTAHWQHITYTACCCCGDTQPPHSTFSQATIHFERRCTEYSHKLSRYSHVCISGPLTCSSPRPRPARGRTPTAPRRRWWPSLPRNSGSTSSSLTAGRPRQTSWNFIKLFLHNFLFQTVWAFDVMNLQPACLIFTRFKAINRSCKRI